MIMLMLMLSTNLNLLVGQRRMNNVAWFFSSPIYCCFLGKKKHVKNEFSERKETNQMGY